jgi:LAO/AO transport system kinase
VLVPEAGDEIQHIKSGLMEIGDAFIVNKADREGADTFANKLGKMLHQRPAVSPIFKTIADKQQGIDELLNWIGDFDIRENKRKIFLYTEKAFRLIQNYRMQDISKPALQQAIAQSYLLDDFNLYKFITDYLTR